MSKPTALFTVMHTRVQALLSIVPVAEITPGPVVSRRVHQPGPRRQCPFASQEWTHGHDRCVQQARPHLVELPPGADDVASPRGCGVVSR